MPKQFLALAAALVIATFLAAPRAALAAPPISIAPLPAQPSTTGNPQLYVGPRDPNPYLPTKWEVILTPPVLGIHVGHVPGTDAYLFLGRAPPSETGSPNFDELAGVLELPTLRFRNVTSPTVPFCGGMAALRDGRLVVAGGNYKSASGTPDGRQSLRVYDYRANPTLLPDVVSMSHRRWYPSVTLMPDSTVLINGGTYTGAEWGVAPQVYERWDPANPTRTPAVRYPLDNQYYTQAEQNFYPFQFVLPTGDVVWIIDSISRFMKPDFTFRKNADGSFLTVPPLPYEWRTQFPHLGTAAMINLTPADNYGSVEIVVFGGAPRSNNCSATKKEAQQVAASPYSFRLKISWTLQGGDWAYSFSGWEKEFMGIPRVGGQVVGLPNGDLVLMVGAQTGCVGGVANSTLRGNNPAFWPLLYQPDRPSGQRYTVMQAGTIPRVYHGTATLTRDGTILQAGCDACNKKHLVTNVTFWTPVKTRRDYRVERFTTPYTLDTNARPKILTVNGNADDASVITVTYGGTITIEWEPFNTAQTDLKITSVTLVAPSTATHGFNTNHRVVNLPIISGPTPVTSSSLTVQVPSNVNVLPQQFYMLFLNNGKTYSQGRWVRL